MLRKPVRARSKAEKIMSRCSLLHGMRQDGYSEGGDLVDSTLKKYTVGRPMDRGGQSVSTDGRSVSPSLTNFRLAGGLTTDRNIETVTE